MNPYEYLLPVQNKNFVGRYEIVDRICTQTTHSGGQVYAILAGRRCGKTSLLNMVRQALLDGFANNPVIPVAVDMEKGFDSPEHFYGHILRKVHYQAEASWPELSQFIVRREQNKISNTELEESLLNLLNTIKLRVLVRIVLLIDEVDLVLRHPWYTTLFEQLRELLTSSDIKDNISLVLFGADYFYETKEQGGSPLLNVAIPEFLYNVNRADINDLIEIGGKCSGDIANQVWTFSGGQLHVAQYILHHIWKPTGFKDVRENDIRKAVNQYYRDHLSNLRKWLGSTGGDGCLMYDLLAQSGEWMDELILAKKAKISVNQAKTALDKLCLQGVVIIDRENYTHYKVQGDLFKQWFSRNRKELMKPLAGVSHHSKKQSDDSGVTEYSHGTYIEHIDIVQQVIEAHSIKGNLSQSTKLKRSEVTKLFKTIYDDIERRPSTTLDEKKNLTKTVKEIEKNISSQKPSKKFLEERFHNLGKMAPDILDVTLAALSNPAMGLKVLAEKIAAKIKSNTS